MLCQPCPEVAKTKSVISTFPATNPQHNIVKDAEGELQLSQTQCTSLDFNNLWLQGVTKIVLGLQMGTVWLNLKFQNILLRLLQPCCLLTSFW